MKIICQRDGLPILEGTPKELCDYIMLTNKAANKERLIITDFSRLWNKPTKEDKKKL